MTPINKNKSVSQVRTISLSFCLIALISVFGFWKFQSAQINKNVERSLEKETVNIKKEIEEIFKSRVLSLIRMAKRWEMRKGIPLQEMESDAGYYRKHQSGFLSIFMTNPNLKLIWSSPANSIDNDKISKFVNSTKFQYIDKLESKVDQAIIYPPIPNNSSSEILLNIPLNIDGKLTGYLASLIDIHAMLNPTFKDKANLGYGLSIHFGSQEIYSTTLHNPEQKPEFVKNLDINFNEVKWTSNIWIQDKSKFIGKGLLPNLTLFLGILIVLLLTIGINFGITSQINAKELIKSRTNIIKEMKKTERAKEEEIKTQRKLQKSQEMLRQSQKLETAGRLAGGIAHDYNNILAAIQLNAEFIHESLENDEQAKEDIKQIEQAVQRGMELTKQLLAFSKTQVLNMENLNLDSVVKDLMKMLNRVIGEDVQLEMNTNSKGSNVKADKIQLEQILMNLVVNSRDAMPKGGKLHLETGLKTYSKADADLDVDLKPGTYAFLTVEDTGEGMDKETLTQIFEPFFTTKGKDKGTGLGMSTVFGIVKQMGGFIHAYSEVNIGTTIKIYFPALISSKKQEANHQAPVTMVQGHGKILLVEDEEDVRNSVSKVLKKFGYNVIEADSLDSASQTLQSDINLKMVVSDVILPDGTGPELVKSINGNHPDLKFLFISGYTNRISSELGDVLTKENFLQKPFTIKQLSEKIKDVLSTHDTES